MPQCLSFTVLLAVIAVPAAGHAAERPNIVWIVSEDNSIHYLNHFFQGGAKAPQIEALASHGLTFNHAFSNAPVCSVARTTLATGCYGPRIGTQYHRRYWLAPMPAGLRMFPAYLREAGYYTTNNSKKDYNAVEGPGVWDESSKKASWRNRPAQNQPFFHMQSHAESHESSLHFGRNVYDNQKTSTDPASVSLAEYHPDTPIFRYTHARYLDRMAKIDEIVGQTIGRLKADGLLEDTFVFYFGDHGGVLPRGKGYVYESGLHVPLVVRVPNNFRHLVDFDVASRVAGFVNFIDFGPTVLQLAGIAVPDQVDGRPFLGAGISAAEVNGRDESFGYADRFDEKYDLIRSLRKGKYQYIRNYQPYLPDGLNNNYRYKSLAFKEWRELFNSGQLSGVQRQFYEPKSTEQLFDCDSDPHQVRNLAGNPDYADVLADLRARLRDRLKRLPDLSFYPESYLTETAMQNPVAFGQARRNEIATLIDTADLALVPFEQAEPAVRKALTSNQALIRYWGAMVCTAFGEQAKPLAPTVRPLLTDDLLTVQIRAAEFLGRVGEINPQPQLTAIVNQTKNPVIAIEALNSVVWFRDFFGDRYPVQRSDFHPMVQDGDIDDRLNYINGEPYPRETRRPRGNRASRRPAVVPHSSTGRAAAGPPSGYEITAPPESLALGNFYVKHVSASEYPVISSANVSDYALKEAAFLVDMMLAERPDVRKAMIAGGSRLVVMAYNEFTTDIPEYSRMQPKDYWDARARGLGGSRRDPLCSCAEENLLGYTGDPYSTENILIHEFAHNIHLRGMVNVDSTFDGRLKEAYERAMTQGLWKGKYASTNHAEYFAEGVQSWFNNNRPPDHDHNHVDTRRELQEYDPALAALCAEVFGETELIYTKPATRLTDHMAGYDPAQSPVFRWPDRLTSAKQQIAEQARKRSEGK